MTSKELQNLKTTTKVWMKEIKKFHVHSNREYERYNL